MRCYCMEEAPLLTTWTNDNAAVVSMVMAFFKQGIAVHGMGFSYENYAFDFVPQSLTPHRWMGEGTAILSNGTMER